MTNAEQNVDENGRKYSDMTMPTGITFRNYEDDPFKWVQVSPGESWFEPVYSAWAAGEMKGGKK